MHCKSCTSSLTVNLKAYRSACTSQPLAAIENVETRISEQRYDWTKTPGLFHTPTNPISQHKEYSNLNALTFVMSSHCTHVALLMYSSKMSSSNQTRVQRKMDPLCALRNPASFVSVATMMLKTTQLTHLSHICPNEPVVFVCSVKDCRLASALLDCPEPRF